VRGAAEGRDPSLGDPLVLPCGAVLRNRVAKAAMSEQLADLDGRPSPALVALYRRWGRAGSGLLLTGNMMIDRDGLSEPRQVVVDGDRHLDALRAWAAAGRESGAHLWAQLNHAGGQVPRLIRRSAKGPSSLGGRRSALLASVDALSGDEIHRLVARFARAAETVVAAGFTGVQVHGAHGYLVSQFLSPLTNTRGDRWGGSSERRRRFLLEVLRAVRERVGPDVPLAVKLNSADFIRGGITEADCLETVSELATVGLDLVEISGGTFESAAMINLEHHRPSTRRREAYFQEFAELVRGSVDTPVMVTGGFRTAAGMQQALDAGIDVVGLARPMALDPDLPGALLAGTTDRALRVDAGARGPRMIRAASEIGWYTREIHRRAAGEPTGRGPGAGTTIRYLAGQAWDARRAARLDQP
jgi:2,4-dienoyl-CoA reductase-like NADH-dependent reductase (Old Yellow Enzyme family)